MKRTALSRTGFIATLVLAAQTLTSTPSLAVCSYGWKQAQACAGIKGTVSSMIVYDDGSGPALFVAGAFDVAGDASALNIAKWDGHRWTALSAGLNGSAACLAVYDGRLIVGGDFTMADGIPASCIAQWNGHTWSPLGEGITGPSWPIVRALTVHDGHLIAGGCFQSAGGQIAANIASWDGCSWSPVGAGLDAELLALATYRNTLIAAGNIWLPGTSSTAVVSWDGASWQAVGGGTNGLVSCLAVHDDRLIAGGDFSSIAGISANGIAEWDGNAWNDMRLPPTQQVESLFVSNGTLWAAGYLNADYGNAPGVMSWDGSSWAGDMQLNAPPLAFAAFEGMLHAGGFSTPGDPTYRAIARLENGRWVWPEPTDSSILALAVVGGQLVAGGDFTRIGNTPANHVASYDGRSWSALGTGTNGRVSAVIQSGTDLVAGGSFSMAGGVTCNNIARWNGKDWSPIGMGVDGEVFALGTYANRLIAAGSFTLANDPGVQNLAQWDGEQWLGIGGFSSDGAVKTLTQFNGKLVAGGFFQHVNSLLAYGIAEWDGTAWTTFQCEHHHGGIDRLAVYNNTLFAAAPFGDVDEGGNLSRWTGSDWVLVPGIFLIDWITDMTVYEDKLVVCGYFEFVDGQPAGSIASWDGTSWDAMAGGLGSMSYGEALCTFQGNLAVGGRFQNAFAQPSANFALWGPLTIETQPEHVYARAGGSAQLALTATDAISFEWRRGHTSLVDDGRISGTQTATLIFAQVAETDAAEDYNCVVTGPCGIEVSREVSLVVQPQAKSDFNLDGVVDQADVDALEACLTGPDLQYIAGCQKQDIDGDGDVDQSDFGTLQACLTGPGASPASTCY